jgi:hypothetical protein
VEEQIPARQQRADVERKAQLVGSRGLLHGLAGHQVGVDRPQVFVGRFREVVIGERRVKVAPPPVDAFAHRPLKGVFAPGPDAGIDVGRDVGRVYGPEWRRQLQAARIRRAAGPGVARDARAEPGEFLALGHKIGREVCAGQGRRRRQFRVAVGISEEAASDDGQRRSERDENAHDRFGNVQKGPAS